MATSDKVGKLTRASAEEFTFTLAEWEPPEERYQRRYIPVTPASRLITGSEDQIAPDETIAEWHIDDWSGGRGKKTWESGRYNRSFGLHPGRDGGLVAGWHVEEVDSGGSPVTDSLALQPVEATLYSAGTAGLFRLGVSPAGSSWTETFDPPSTPITFTSPTGITGGADASHIFILDDTAIEKVVLLTSYDSTFSTGLTADGNLLLFDSILYVLENGELSSVDQTVGTLTAVAGSTTTRLYQNATLPGAINNQLSASDVGPVWVSSTRSGDIVIREYNVADDSEAVIAQIPLRNGVPLDIDYSNGFYMCLVMTSNAPTQWQGDVFLWLYANGVPSLIGPLPNTDSANGTVPDSGAVIAGMIGNEIFLWYDGALLAYDLNTGALHSVAVNFPADTDYLNVVDAGIVGNQVFVASPADSNKVYQVDPTAYDDTSTMWLSSGKYDFGYRGVDKLIMDITIQLDDALDASDQIEVKYNLDSAGWTSAGTMTSADGISKTFALTNAICKTLGLRVELELNDSTNTPTILSLTARAAGAEYRPEWVLQVDITDEHSAAKIKELRDLSLQHEVLTFADPYQVDVTTAPESFSVTIEEVLLPPEQDDGVMAATVRLRATETV